MTREEREDAINFFKEVAKQEVGTYCKLAIEALEQKEKTGHWIVHPKGIYAHLVCDKCLSNAPYDCRTNYCPNCGIRMVSE